ncbi:MAG TPA: universal stress protein [Sphingomicrobium sp.]|nr:universal stress protein [Sphingomicrobium sp.]
MSSQIHLEPEQKPMFGASARAAAATGPKTILVHIQDDATIETRLESALSLARAFSAHIACLHVTPSQAYVAYDGFGGVFIMGEVFKAIEEQEASLRQRIEAELSNEDVSWDYVQATGETATQLIGRAALADLIVSGREPARSDFVGPAMSLLGDLVCRSRTPVFIPAEGAPPCDPNGTALIAWDGSYEAANAVRSTVGMLAQAAQVHVLQVEEEKSETFPGTRLLEYLSRHAIHAELTVESVDDVKFDNLVPETLVTRAVALGAAYIVMGGNNHSRLGEYVFGGVTRTMLSASPVPILLAR